MPASAVRTLFGALCDGSIDRSMVGWWELFYPKHAACVSEGLGQGGTAAPCVDEWACRRTAASPIYCMSNTRRCLPVGGGDGG